MIYDLNGWSRTKNGQEMGRDGGYWLLGPHRHQGGF